MTPSLHHFFMAFVFLAGLYCSEAPAQNQNEREQERLHRICTSLNNQRNQAPDSAETDPAASDGVEIGGVEVDESLRRLCQGMASHPRRSQQHDQQRHPSESGADPSGENQSCQSQRQKADQVCSRQLNLPSLKRRLHEAENSGGITETSEQLRGLQDEMAEISAHAGGECLRESHSCKRACDRDATDSNAQEHRKHCASLIGNVYRMRAQAKASLEGAKHAEKSKESAHEQKVAKPTPAPGASEGPANPPSLGGTMPPVVAGGEANSGGAPSSGAASNNSGSSGPSNSSVGARPGAASGGGGPENNTNTQKIVDRMRFPEPDPSKDPRTVNPQASGDEKSVGENKSKDIAIEKTAGGSGGRPRTPAPDRQQSFGEALALSAIMSSAAKPSQAIRPSAQIAPEPTTNQNQNVAQAQKQNSPEAGRENPAAAQAHSAWAAPTEAKPEAEKPMVASVGGGGSMAYRAGSPRMPSSSGGARMGPVGRFEPSRSQSPGLDPKIERPYESPYKMIRVGSPDAASGYSQKPQQPDAKPLHLADFLPNGSQYQNGHSPSGMEGGPKPEIQSRAKDIWELVSERFKIRCAQERLMDCRQHLPRD